MASTEIPSVASKLYELLEPLEAQLRKRAIKAALAMLGDDDFGFEPANAKGTRTEESDGADRSDLPRKVQTWMKSNSLGDDHLQHTFHIQDGKVELIAGDSPGRNGKERTINAYVLTGPYSIP